MQVQRHTTDELDYSLTFQQKFPKGIVCNGKSAQVSPGFLLFETHKLFHVKRQQEPADAS